MKYCQVTQEGNLNFRDLFIQYDTQANFATAINNPVPICAGNFVGNGTNLLTNQSTMLSTINGVASVVGLITCTALIAKCGADSNYFVAHLNAGYVDADIQSKLTQLKQAYPTEPWQAVYVIPEHSFLGSYANDVNTLNGLGYEVCFITKPSQKISMVMISSTGDMCIR